MASAPNAGAAPTPTPWSYSSDLKVDVDVDAGPYLPGRFGDHLDRAVPAVDGVDTDSTSYGGSSSRRSSSSSSAAAATATGTNDVLYRAAPTLPPAPSMVVETINVERSRHVQVGNSTHYHGPVTLVVSKDTIGAPACQGSDGDVVLSATALGISSPTIPLAPHSNTPAGTAVPTKQKISLKTTQLWLYVTAVVAGLLVLGSIVAAILYFPPNLPSVERLPNGVNLAVRAVWGALPPTEEPKILPTPVKTVIIHHTGAAPCFSLEDCCKRVLTIQQYHRNSVNREWNDIGYNFLIGGDGVSYEGRGWDAVGAHLIYWNSRSLGVALIGNFVAEAPSAPQRSQLDAFLRWAMELGKVDRQYHLVGACQLQATKSPGMRFMEDLRSWDHWWNSSEVSNPCTE